jgi:hypothetical protein
MNAFMGLHRTVILVLRILVAREEMRLPERQKALARLHRARHRYFQSTLHFLTLPATLSVTLYE